MAKKECETCGEIWDTRQWLDCPSCRSILQKDLEEARLERVRLADITADEISNDEAAITSIHFLADEADGNARTLNLMANLVSLLGVLGGVIFAVSGFAAGDSPNLVVISTGVGVILFWLLVRAFGVAFASRIRLASAVAKAHEERSDIGL